MAGLLASSASSVLLLAGLTCFREPLANRWLWFPSLGLAVSGLILGYRLRQPMIPKQRGSRFNVDPAPGFVGAEEAHRP
jgi:hypothetical protein